MKKQMYRLGIATFLGLGTLLNAQVTEGAVGINTGTPKATLDIVTKEGANKSLRIQNTANAETVTVLNNGKVGIGTDNPSLKLDVDGEVRIRKIPAGDTSTDQVLLADTNGNVKKTAVSNLGKTYKGSTSVILKGDSFERAALSGDVVSAQNSNALKVEGIQNHPVAETAPQDGQVLKWNGNQWAPAQDGERFLKKDWSYVAQHTEFICDSTHEGKYLEALEGYFECKNNQFYYTGIVGVVNAYKISKGTGDPNFNSAFYGAYIDDELLYIGWDTRPNQVSSPVKRLLNGSNMLFHMNNDKNRPNDLSAKLMLSIIIKKPTTNW